MVAGGNSTTTSSAGASPCARAARAGAEKLSDAILVYPSATKLHHGPPNGFCVFHVKHSQQLLPFRCNAKIFDDAFHAGNFVGGLLGRHATGGDPAWIDAPAQAQFALGGLQFLNCADFQYAQSKPLPHLTVPDPARPRPAGPCHTRSSPCPASPRLDPASPDQTRPRPDRGQLPLVFCPIPNGVDFGQGQFLWLLIGRPLWFGWLAVRLASERPPR
jgi:hypothetical protein